MISLLEAYYVNDDYYGEAIIYDMISEKCELLEHVADKYNEYSSHIYYDESGLEEGWLLNMIVPFKDNTDNGDHIIDYIEFFNDNLRFYKLKKIINKL